MNNDSIFQEEIDDIPIYCINLKRARERREKMLQEWTIKRGIDLIFFEAFDRRNLDINNLPSPFSLKNKKLSTGEICCSISHAMLLQLIISKGHNQAIVLEDDADPLFENKYDFFNKLNTYKLDKNQANIILMHDRLNENLTGSNGKFKPFMTKDQISFQKYHHILKYRCIGAQSIFYKDRKAMKHSFLSISLLDCPTDWAWNHFLGKTNVKLGIYANPLTSHKPEDSYINEEGTFGLIYRQ
jgi:GR25 family glycosyltransferase involved in LPS biosynthesis